jgi:hypothetical protein
MSNLAVVSTLAIDSEFSFSRSNRKYTITSIDELSVVYVDARGNEYECPLGHEVRPIVDGMISPKLKKVKKAERMTTKEIKDNKGLEGRVSSLEDGISEALKKIEDIGTSIQLILDALNKK